MPAKHGRASSHATPSSEASVATIACGTFLAIAILLGGSTKQGYWADDLLILASLPLLGWAILRLRLNKLEGAASILLLLVSAAIVWFIVQCLPLPAGLWALLSGRAELVSELSKLGLDREWRPITLDTDASIRAVFGMLPAVSVGLMVLTLSVAQRLLLLKWVIAAAVACAILGLMQLTGGTDSPLRWHEITNQSSAVGPFANRNHLASLLAAVLPLSATLLMSIISDERKSSARPVTMSLAALAMILLIVGLAMTRSRAGVAIGAVALLGVGWIAWRGFLRVANAAISETAAVRWLLAVVLAASILVVQFALVQLIQRFDKDPLEDQRWQIAETTVDAIGHYGWFGAGPGTFVPVYEAAEPTDQRTHTYVNRAHNDWLEWWLEGGVPLMLLLAVGLVLLVRATVQAFRTKRHTGWRIAAAMAVWIILLHSLADYPLRTISIGTVFALCLASLFEGSSEADIRVRRVRKAPVDLRRKTAAEQGGAPQAR